MLITLPPIKIFADGASAPSMLEAYRSGLVSGFTTNPTLMKRAGVRDYAAFAREILATITDAPVSFETLSDEFATMEDEARMIGGWADNVYVKIPITNTRGESSLPTIRRLSGEGLKINVTAILTEAQAKQAIDALAADVPGVVSIFAGRIADTGCDPEPIMRRTARRMRRKPNLELLWGSPRELFNLFQAAKAGCHIITMTDELLKKLPMIGYDLEALSLDTVRMFFRDAQESRLSL